MSERGSWLSAFRRLFAAQSTAPLQSRMCLLDGLRGLAAFAVIFFHYDHFFQRGPEMTVPGGDREHMPLFRWLAPFYDHGNLAVQVFWIISGFVFAAVYYGRGATTRSFVVNRFARLYPLHLLTLCLVALLQLWAVYRVGHWLIFGNNTPANFIKQLFFYAWNSRTGWSFNGPIWSVSVEAVIYLLFWLSHRQLPRLGVAGPGGACVLSMALMSVFGHNVVLSCSYYFFFGSTIAVLQSRLPRGPLPMMLAVLAAFGGAIVIAKGSHDIRDYVALPVACASIVLVLGWVEVRAARSIRRVASRLGDYSYGVYLWHVPVQLVLLLTLGSVGDVPTMARSGWFLLAFFALVGGLAAASFHLFEAPARRLVRSWGEVRAAGPAIAGP